MTNVYQAPDPEIAEFVHRINAECDRQNERLEQASVAELKTVARNRAESSAARGTALMNLLAARDPEFTEILLDLFDDPDQDLWRMAIVGARGDDPRIRVKLQSKLNDAEDQNWSEAAFTLARFGDESLLPQFIVWLETGDEPHRNVAVECLKWHKTPAARRALEEYWDRGAGNDESRLDVAAALFDLGDPRGRPLLDSIAQRGVGSWSVFAATAVYITQPRDGLTLMLRILDHGDLEARQSMVNQIWNFAHLPHAFTADGLAEARVWVERQLQENSLDGKGLRV